MARKTVSKIGFYDFERIIVFKRNNIENIAYRRAHCYAVRQRLFSLLRGKRRERGDKSSGFC